MKYFVVSDTHFGNPRENEEKFRKNCLTLIDIIKDKNPDEVILNGDILDTYFAMNIEDNPHKELYHALIDSHDKIRYILGNHDIIYKNQKKLGKIELCYPFHIDDGIMFIHGHQFEIFHAFPFSYSNLERVLSYIDSFWEMCPVIFQNIHEIYGRKKSPEEIKKIKENLLTLKARTMFPLLLRLIGKSLLEEKFEKMVSSTYSMLSVVVPKILLGDPFYSENPPALDEKMNRYGREWTGEPFDTICYGHIHKPFIIREKYFSFVNSGMVTDSGASYVEIIEKKHIRLKKF